MKKASGQKILSRIVAFGAGGIVCLIASLRSYSRHNIDDIFGYVACYIAVILFHLGYWFEIERREQKNKKET